MTEDQMEKLVCDKANDERLAARGKHIQREQTAATILAALVQGTALSVGLGDGKAIARAVELADALRTELERKP